MSFQLDDTQPFSRSKLWTLQRRYFDEMGYDAWRLGEVPHYVTSNQRIANSYAEIIFAFYKELQTQCPTPSLAEPCYLLEAGAGSGRFGYYLVKRLHALCEQEGFPVQSFCYILSDFTQSNLDFWKAHHCLEPYFANGSMDIALFDMTLQDSIQLQCSGKELKQNSLSLPLVFIANYVFDSIPQELVYCVDGNCTLAQVALHSTEDPSTSTAAALLEKLSCSFSSVAEDRLHFPEPWLNSLIDVYQQQLKKGYFFFPATGIRSLAHLRFFSAMGLLVLTADKGSHDLLESCFENTPDIVRHGSFSLNVNYHAFKLYCEQLGGEALFPEYQYGSINTGCLFLIPQKIRHHETKRAYQKYVIESGPDDYFTLYHHLSLGMDAMPFKVILSALRFSLYDSHLLGICLGRFMELAPEMNANDMADVLEVIHQCWNNYFPLGEQNDLANRIATFCYEINHFEEAIFYFKMSTDIYGNDVGTLFNMAACYHQMHQFDDAAKILRIVLTHHPGNDAARDLLQTCQSSLTE